MEFVKVGKNYMIKGGNGRIVSEKEKLELENKELVIKDIKGCECQQETTKKISKNKKRIKELENEEIVKNIEINDIKISKDENEYEITALNEEGDSADDIIKKAD